MELIVLRPILAYFDRGWQAILFGMFFGSSIVSTAALILTVVMAVWYCIDPLTWVLFFLVSWCLHVNEFILYINSRKIFPGKKKGIPFYVFSPNVAHNHIHNFFLHEMSFLCSLHLCLLALCPISQPLKPSSPALLSFEVPSTPVPSIRQSVSARCGLFYWHDCRIWKTW